MLSLERSCLLRCVALPCFLKGCKVEDGAQVDADEWSSWLKDMYTYTITAQPTIVVADPKVSLISYLTNLLSKMIETGLLD